MSVYIENRLLTRPVFNFPAFKIDPHEQLNTSHYAEMRGFLFEDLILYDRLLIPTYDFTIIALLHTWLGKEKLIELLSEGTLQILRMTPWLGYGGGIGLSLFNVRGQSCGNSDLLPICFGNTDEAVDSYLKRYINTPFDTILASTLKSSTVTVALNENFNQLLKPMTIKAFADIHPALLARHGSDDLPGVARNALSIFNPWTEKHDTPAEKFLAVAQMSVELALLSQSKATHAVSDSRIQQYLNSQLSHADKPAPCLQGHFNHLIHHCELPNIPAFVNQGGLQLSKILKLRDHRAIREFRPWLETLDPDDKSSATRGYIRAVEKNGISDKFSLKTASFLIPSIVGAISPVAGSATSFISFLASLFGKSVEKRRNTPKFAISSMRDLLIKP